MDPFSVVLQIVAAAFVAIAVGVIVWFWKAWGARSLHIHEHSAGSGDSVVMQEDDRVLVREGFGNVELDAKGAFTVLLAKPGGELMTMTSTAAHLDSPVSRLRHTFQWMCIPAEEAVAITLLAGDEVNCAFIPGGPSIFFQMYPNRRVKQELDKALAYAVTSGFTLFSALVVIVTLQVFST